MCWRKNFCYWLIVTGEVHRVRAAVRKHEPGSAGQDEAKESKKQIGATPPIYDTFESEPDVLECWRYECLAKGFGGRCNFFDGGKWIGNTCKDFGEGSEKRSYLDILNRVIASFSFEDIGSLTSQVEEAAPPSIKNLFLWLKDQLPSTAEALRAEAHLDAEAVDAASEAANRAGFRAWRAALGCHSRVAKRARRWSLAGQPSWCCSRCSAPRAHRCRWDRKRRR